MRSAQKGGRFRVTRGHSFFLSSVPDALTRLGTALHFYDITFRYAPTPQAKGRGGGRE